MGITSSLVTALSGLSTSQSQIDVVGNNIANVNTVGFKASRLDFKTQFLENFSFGSAPNGNLGGTNPLQIGLGATQGAITKNFGNGSLEVTGVPTNLAIQGSGMFILQSAGQQVYTRDGSFQLNGLNQLVTGTGALVQGYGVDANFNIVPGQLTSMNIPLGSMTIAEPTSKAILTGNLNAAGSLPTTVSNLTSQQPMYLSDGAGGVDPVNPPTAATLLTNVTDASGVPQFQVGDVLSFKGTRGTASITSQKMTVTSTTTLGDLTAFMNGTLGIDTSAGANGPIATVPGTTLITDPSGTGNSVDINISGNPGSANDISIAGSDFTLTRGGSTSFPMSFNKTATADGESVYSTMSVYDSLGTTVHVNVVATLTSQTSSGSTWTFYATSPDDMPSTTGAVQSNVGLGSMTFDTSGRLVNTSNTSLTVNRSGTGALPTLSFKLDVSGVTGLADPNNTGGGSTLKMVDRDGSPMGTLQTFEIGQDGVVSGTFSNGLSRNLGQIALATFRNEQGLVDQGNNNYIAGPNSGNAVVVAPSQLGAGSISAGALELSNVDLSGEFVALIAASTAFSASSRVISSSNSLLQDLLSAAR